MTEPGIRTMAGGLLCKPTMVPLTEGAPRVTVPVAFAPPVTWSGETATPVSVADAGGFTVSVADCVRLPYLAEIVTVRAVVPATVVIVNETEVWPEGMLTP